MGSPEKIAVNPDSQIARKVRSAVTQLMTPPPADVEEAQVLNAGGKLVVDTASVNDQFPKTFAAKLVARLKALGVTVEHASNQVNGGICYDRWDLFVGKKS